MGLTPNCRLSRSGDYVFFVSVVIKWCCCYEYRSHHQVIKPFKIVLSKSNINRNLYEACQKPRPLERIDDDGPQSTESKMIFSFKRIWHYGSLCNNPQASSQLPQSSFLAALRQNHPWASEYKNLSALTSDQFSWPKEGKTDLSSEDTG